VIKDKPPLTEEEKLAKWALEDEALEKFCRFEGPDARAPRVYEVSVPDAWRNALAYVSAEERKRIRKSSLKTTKRREEPAGPFQMPAEYADELVWYFEVFPSVCGLRSSWREQAEAMDECSKCGARYAAKSKRTTCPNGDCRYPRGSFHSSSYMRVASGAGSAWHPSYDAELLGIVSSGSVERSRRVRDTLLDMIEAGDSHMVNVLWLAYGDQHPYSPYSLFGNLAQLVGLTNAAIKACGGDYNRETIDQKLRESGGTTLENNIKQQAGKLLESAGVSYCKWRKGN
jgi:hypothetical protein